MNGLILMNAFLKPVAKLLAALAVAFISATFAGFSIALIASWVVVIANMLLNNSASFGELLAIPTVGALYLTGAFGIYIPMYVALQIVLFGIPAAIVAWLFKLTSLKNLAIAGFVLAGFPWIPMAGILVFLEGSTDIPHKFLNFGAVALIGLLLGLCGFIGGTSFGIALKFLKLEDHGTMHNSDKLSNAETP
jgi:hypothetical protein